MTNAELVKILKMHSAAIIAPAGHGKTEMIAEIVKYSEGKQLLLTHTNAGVDVLEKRLRKWKIPTEKYAVTTIASFCTRWCVSYYCTSYFDKSLSPLNGRDEAKEYYAQLYRGAKRILSTSWAVNVMKATYTGIVVDEYQDCIQEQHEIILKMNQYMPVKVLGDPLQGIFSFAGDIVDWKNLEYPVIPVDTKPWRWIKSNPELGEYLMTVREELLPILNGKSCRLLVNQQNKNVQIVAPNDFTGYSHLRELSYFSSIVYITKWPKQQLEFCFRIPGIFQFDEKQDCDELFNFAKSFDINKGAELVLTVINFAKICSTGIGEELKTYISKLKVNSFDFARIKKAIDFRKILEETAPFPTKQTVLKMLYWISENKNFKKYRSELLTEMIRSVKYAIDYNIPIFDAANHIRKDLSLQKKYNNFKFLSSRTLLSKGLEFDCVIIDMTNPLSAKDFYVAMTRAMKKIYIISNTNIFYFENDK